MVSIRDVDPQIFIRAYAAYLKQSKEFQVPSWADLVKTGASKETAPLDPDWFYTRAAAMVRQIGLKPKLGVGALRTKFGSSKNRGTRPSRHSPASGSVIRKALQSLEKIEILEQNEKGGRSLSSKGWSGVDRIVMTCLSGQSFIQ